MDKRKISQLWGAFQTLETFGLDVSKLLEGEGDGQQHMESEEKSIRRRKEDTIEKEDKTVNCPVVENALVGNKESQLNFLSRLLRHA